MLHFSDYLLLSKISWLFFNSGYNAPMTRESTCKDVDIRDLDPAEVLRTLQNAASFDDIPLDVFSLPAANISHEEAREILARERDHTLIRGKYVFVELHSYSQSVDLCLFDQFNGEGKGRWLIEKLRGELRRKAAG